MIGSDSYIDLDLGDLSAGFDALDEQGDPLPQTLQMERRERLRYPIHMSAFCLHGEEAPSKALIWDFSTSGIRLSRVLRSATDPTISVAASALGDKMLLLLRLPESRDPFTLSCEVRRLRRDDDYEELGLEATNIDPVVFQSLSRLSDRVQVKLHSRLPQLFGEHDWSFVDRYLDMVASEIFRRMHEMLTLLTEWGEDASTRSAYFYAMVEMRPMQAGFKRLLAKSMFDSIDLDLSGHSETTSASGIGPRELDEHTLRKLDWVDFERASTAQKATAANESPFARLASRGVPLPEGLFSDPSSVLAPTGLSDCLRKCAARASIPSAAAPVFSEVVTQVALLYWDTLTTTAV